MTDYSFPLSPESLYQRYGSLFAGLKKGLSSTLIGLPFSCRSAFLKFILDQGEKRTKFLGEFIDHQRYRFIFIDKLEANPLALVKELAVKLVSRQIFPKELLPILKDYLTTDDYYLLSSVLLDGLAKVEQKTKIIIILYQAENVLKSPEAASFLFRLWQINRSLTPDPFIRLVFIGSPLLLELKNSSYIGGLKLAIEENIQFFPLFSKLELDYTRRRISYLTGEKIDLEVHHIASYLSGGHYLLYRTLINLPEKELAGAKKMRSHPAVDATCQTLWQSLPAVTRLNWRSDFLASHPFTSKLALVKNGRIILPLLPPKSSIFENDLRAGRLPQLTGQEKLIFDHLLLRINQIIERDEIAQVIWGKRWQKKYSDWAIDKTMSNLRKKLSATKWALISIRNRGYKLAVL